MDEYDDRRDEIIEEFSRCLMTCREHLVSDLQLDDPPWRKKRIQEVIQQIDDADRLARLLGG